MLIIFPLTNIFLRYFANRQYEKFNFAIIFKKDDIFEAALPF